MSSGVVTKRVTLMGAGAAGAHGDVDAKDAGEQGHPGQRRRSSASQLSLERDWGGRELDMSARDKQRELLGLGRRGLSARDDRRAQGVVSRQDAVVQNRVRPRWRDERTQPSQEGVRAHPGVGGPEAVGFLEVRPNVPVGGALDGIEGEGRAQEIAADSLEALAVSAVHGDGGVQLHAEAPDQHRRSPS